MSKHTVWVVSFLEQKSVHFTFTEWPNHITIVPHFQTTDLEKLMNNIQTACTRIHNIPYQVSSINYFGKEKNVKVSEVILSDALAGLHTSILSVALNGDKNMDTKFCYQNYKPHITHNNQPYPQENDLGIIRTIYLIEKLSPLVEEKQIVEVINLLPQDFRMSSSFSL